MSRSVPEWIGATPDAEIPPRVRLRIFQRSGGLCTECGVRLVARWEIDHRIALINGGLHTESNLQAVCKPCHDQKTKKDIAEKAMVYRKRKAHLGIRKPSRFPGSRDSGWKKRMDGTVVRREDT